MTLTTLDVWQALGADLRRFIARRVADPDDADDVLQDVFVKLHAKLGTLRDDDSVAPWVYRIARRAVIDHHRARRPTVPLPGAGDADADVPSSDGDAAEVALSIADPDPAVEPGLAALADDAERCIARYLAGLVDRLPAHYRQAVHMSELEGLPQSAVAARLGLSPSGAKSRVQRGRAMLRAQLLECCHVELDRRGRVIDYRPRVMCCPRCEACGAGTPSP